MQLFKEDSLKLFDICSCKCKDFENFNCDKTHKVPKQEREFLLDQRTKRIMCMGSVDVITTKKNQKREIRKIQELSYTQTRSLYLQELSCSATLTEAEKINVFVQ